MIAPDATVWRDLQSPVQVFLFRFAFRCGSGGFSTGRGQPG